MRYFIIIFIFILIGCNEYKLTKEESCDAVFIHIINEEKLGEANKIHINVDSFPSDTLLTNEIWLKTFAERFSKDYYNDYTIVLFYNSKYSTREDSCIGMYMSLDNRYIGYSEKLR